MEENTLSQFNMGHVVEQTGLPADTVRAWQRRYGFPTPQRTAGGHRLFSLTDIEALRWLKAEVAKGVTISQAIALWRQRQAQLHNLQPGQPATQSLAQLRAAWVRAVESYDEPAAERIAQAAFATYPAPDACAGLFERGLAELGEAWHANQLTVQQEHFATALVLRHMYVLLDSCPPPTRPEKVLVACAPDEEHSYPALYIAWELRQLGFPVAYLGANVPVEQLDSAVQRILPAAVVLTASSLATAAGLQQAAASLAPLGVRVYYGGRPFNQFPAIAGQIAGVQLGNELHGAALVLERNLVLPYSVPPRAGRNKYAQRDLRQLEREIAQVAHQMEFEFPKVTMDRINNYWHNNLKAAVALGDLNFLSNELNWAASLLDKAGVPAAALRQYLDGFIHVAKRHLQPQFPIFFEDLISVVNQHLETKGAQ